MLSKRNNYLSGFFLGLIIVLGLLTFLGFFSRYFWIFEISSHFRIQYLFGTVFCLPVFLINKKRILFFTAVIIAVINLLTIIPVYKKKVFDGSGTGFKISVASINIQSGNLKYYKTIDYIKRNNPDVLVLFEINLHWIPAIKNTTEKYPYKQIMYGPNDYGIGIFSKYPLKNTRVEYFCDFTIPSIFSEIELPDKKCINICAVHTLSPGTYKNFKLRNQHFENMIEYLEKKEGSLIVIGDLNISPWSYYFIKIKERLNLYDSRQGFGIQPTWPAFFPLLMTPIDHCLLTDDIKTIKRIAGPSVSSDHLPLYLEFEINN